VANLLNLNELFNPGVVHNRIDIDYATKTVSRLALPNHGSGTELTVAEVQKQADDNLLLLDQMYSINKPAVFGILPQSYYELSHKYMNKLSANPNIQFIHLCRADVLYSIISIFTCIKSAEWHNTTGKQKNRNINKYTVDIDRIKCGLDIYIKTQKEVKEHFGEVHKVYYEQFQFDTSGLRNLFTGLPKNVVSIPYSKFIGNHKDLVENIDEIEDLYEQFVNDNKEYFPQYFGKLPHIQIPACQGRQPRDLSTCGS
jgi:hypothetical protein